MIKDKPWLTELDFVKWIDPATGLRCAIIRNGMGALCGYVRVPRGRLRDAMIHRPRIGHRKILGKTCRPGGYALWGLADVDVHGGLTYSGRLRRVGVNRGLWVGFDCAHWNDLIPKMPRIEFMNNGTYRNMEYVRRECAHLALQINLAAKRREGKSQ